MTSEEIKRFAKETFFRDFERVADLINHPQSEDESEEKRR